MAVSCHSVVTAKYCGFRRPNYIATKVSLGVLPFTFDLFLRAEHSQDYLYFERRVLGADTNCFHFWHVSQLLSVKFWSLHSINLSSRPYTYKSKNVCFSARSAVVLLQIIRAISAPQHSVPVWCLELTRKPLPLRSLTCFLRQRPASTALLCVLSPAPPHQLHRLGRGSVHGETRVH